ncbi:hypothetical protein MLD38_038503 [Melastoma candidum]|uniref:Uncharacterized protein n=1 Tax=Melastoma candidum TaxID=119954 RepID=A0ACB9KZU9_9MYRT|nr:hypothetical protein MLD38_038503 [Melastoma candidum]
MGEEQKAGESLDSLISSFNARVSELQELVIARNMYPASSLAELKAVDSALKSMESQVQAIKDRLRDEIQAIPKAKVIVEASLRQQKRLEALSGYVPSSHGFEVTPAMDYGLPREGVKKHCPDFLESNFEEGIPEPPLPKEKKGRASPPLWYITADELESLSSYMRGRLTLDKVNAAINDMASYADANSQLILCPKKKVDESQWEKALELRDISMKEGLKGKLFFLESDIKGPSLKLDNTGKAILTVLRHLGRISEMRSGHHRIIILLRP